MGQYWLHWLPDYLAAEGVNFRLEDGWRSRSRSSGGFDQVMGVQWHQTVSKTTPTNDIRYMWYNADAAPIGNVLLDRTGLVHVGAAGAANTAGKGGPRNTSRGVVPLDNGNRNLVAIEAANDGYGEPFPVAQCDAYVKLTVAILKGASRETPGAAMTAGDVHSHFEWAPTRKVDPRGPADPTGASVWATGATQLWTMDTARGDVYLAMQPPPPPPPPPHVVAVEPWGTFEIHAGARWPTSVSQAVYGSPNHWEWIVVFNGPQITLDNWQRTWPGIGGKIRVPGKPDTTEPHITGARVGIPTDGSHPGPAEVVGYAFPGTWQQRVAQLPELAKWNGGRYDDFKPGEIVFVRNPNE